MKRLALLCVLPVLAGCFAWDLDEKPLPWYEDPAVQPAAIGQTVTYPGERDPYPAHFKDNWLRAHDIRYQQRESQGACAPPPRPPAPVFELKSETPPAAPVEPDDFTEAEPVPAPAEAAQPAPAGGMEKRLSSLESRLEELYQLILKSYEKKGE